MTYLPLTSTHNGKPVALLEQATLSWAEHPVLMTQIEQSTVNMEHVRKILNNNQVSPSQAAKLPSDLVCLEIRFLDQEFTKETSVYKDDLVKANVSDRHVITKLEKERYSGKFWWLFTFIDYWEQWPFTAKQDIAREGSVHRRRWIYDIDTKEKVRLRQLNEKIELLAMRVLHALAELREKNQTDLELLKVLKQLYAVFKAVFPGNKNETVEAAEKLLNSEEIRKFAAEL